MNFKEYMYSLESRAIERVLKKISQTRKKTITIIYGVGSHTESLLKYIDRKQINIVAICSGNSNPDNVKFNDIPIISKEDLLSYNFEKILISSHFYEEEIFNTLKNDLRISTKRIIRIYNNIFYRLQRYFFDLLKSKIKKRIMKSPMYYDFYYRYFTKVRQGSIEKVKFQKIKKDAPNLMIFANRYWALHVALDTAFAIERMQQGYNVTIIGCDKAISVCDSMFFEMKEKSIIHSCDFCSYLLKKHYKKLGFRYISAREYLKQNKVAESYLNKRDYGKIVYASWIRLLRSINPVEPDEFKVKDGLVKGCKQIDKFFTHYLSNNRVDQIIMTNGKFFLEQLLVQHCEEKKIPFISYEQGLLKNSVRFVKNKSFFPFEIKEKWDRVKDIPLTENQLKKLNNLDNIILKSDAGGIPFYSNMVEDIDIICDEHGVSKDKEIIVLFTNVIWDSGVVEQDTIFKDMFEWIETSINFYKNQNDKQLIIRVHPVEVKISKNQVTRDRVDHFIKSRFGEFDNVIIIPPESEASPYKLMDIAKLGLVYTSSTGYEMAQRNKPVIIAANTHYNETGFVYAPKSKTEYLKLLSENLKPFPNQGEYVLRYIYTYFFDYMIDYSDIISQKKGFTFTKKILESNILESSGV